MIVEGLERRKEGFGACWAGRSATGVDTRGNAVAVVDQRMGGSMGGRVEMAKWDSLAGEGAGGASVGMETAANWAEKVARAHVVV
jgi:hypothetical protein